MRVGVTGATGFVGKATVQRLLDEGCNVYALVRSDSGTNAEFVIGNIANGPLTSLPPLDCLVHLAGISHVPKTAPEEAEARLMAANVLGTKNVLEAAIAAGVRLFIFVSTAKVHGETTEDGSPVNEGSALDPQDAYARSKVMAERLVVETCEKAGIVSVIVRPPLVYGADAGENFRRLAVLARSKFPLPFGGIQNKRSMIFVDNLADCIVRIVVSPAGKSASYLVSDGRDLSTTEVFNKLAVAHGKTLHFLSAKPLFWMLTVFRRRGIRIRIFNNFQVDSRKFREDYQWEPPVGVDEAFRASQSYSC